MKQIIIVVSMSFLFILQANDFIENKVQSEEIRLNTILSGSHQSPLKDFAFGKNVLSVSTKLHPCD